MMTKLIKSVFCFLIIAALATPAWAGDWVKPRAGTTNNISSTFWSSSIVKNKCEKGDMCSYLVFDDEDLAQRGNWSNWSNAFDISNFTFDDDAPQRTRLNLVLAMGNNHNGLSAARGRGSVTLTYQLSNDGSSWFSPISTTDAGTGYFDYLDRTFGLFGISQTQGWGCGVKRSAFSTSLFFRDLTNTQYDFAVQPQIGTITWTASAVSATAWGGAGPYIPTLTANKTISVQKAKFIRFRAKNTGGGINGASNDDAPVVFDLQLLGQ